MRLGNCTTSTKTSAKRMTWPPTNPAKLKELQDLFLVEAKKYNVLPLDPRLVGTHGSETANCGRAADELDILWQSSPIAGTDRTTAFSASVYADALTRSSRVGCRRRDRLCRCILGGMVVVCHR